MVVNVTDSPTHFVAPTGCPAADIAVIVPMLIVAVPESGLVQVVEGLSTFTRVNVVFDVRFPVDTAAVPDVPIVAVRLVTIPLP